MTTNDGKVEPFCRRIECQYPRDSTLKARAKRAPVRRKRIVAIGVSRIPSE